MCEDLLRAAAMKRRSQNNLHFRVLMLWTTSSTGVAHDPEGLYFSDEFKREFLHEYFKEKNKLDGVEEGVDEKLVDRYLALINYMQIVSFSYM